MSGAPSEILGQLYNTEAVGVVVVVMGEAKEMPLTLKSDVRWGGQYLDWVAWEVVGKVGR